MGISNDWQNIDDIAFRSIPASRRDGSCWTEESAQKIADAIGWEIVKFPEGITTITYGGATQDATVITMIRPVDISEEYDIGIFFGEMFESSGYGATGVFFFEPSTGNLIQVLGQISLRPSYLLLRPFGQGCFCIKDSQAQSVIFDRFYNPKTEKEKWGMYAGGYFIDLYTGLTMSCSNTYYLYPASFGGYVAIKKYTAISIAGVFNAMTLYKAYLDYSNVGKNIELDGKRYCGIRGSGIPFYIKLAE